MEDFIRWFLHKDLIIKNEKGPLLIETAFDRIFSFIERYHTVLALLINSSYGPMIEQFIEKEAFAYQLSNFKRIDKANILSDAEVRFYAMFYAAGILKLIVEFISKPMIESHDKSTFIHLGVQIVQNYIERLVHKKQTLLNTAPLDSVHSVSVNQ
jgi:hypothetical protein